MEVKNLESLYSALKNHTKIINAISGAIPGVYLLSTAYEKLEDPDPIEGFLKKSLNIVGLGMAAQAKKNIFSLPFDVKTIKLDPDTLVELSSKHILDAVTFLPNSDKVAEIVELSQLYEIIFTGHNFIFELKCSPNKKSED